MTKEEYKFYTGLDGVAGARMVTHTLSNIRGKREDAYIQCVEALKELFQAGYKLNRDNLAFIFAASRWMAENDTKIWHPVLDNRWM